ncbi:MAG: urate hydroxylase PuuD [Planctomycetota bacterium]
MLLNLTVLADALPEASSITQVFVRWLHVLAGITWIGHLYFFNFVNVPLQGKSTRTRRRW